MKWQPDMKGAYVTWTPLGFGQLLYALYVPNHCYPVGLVWGRLDSKNVFEVGGSYVEPWARRNGVRTRINQEIFRAADVISSTDGSKQGGMAFLKASGYKRSKELRCFYLKKSAS